MLICTDIPLMALAPMNLKTLSMCTVTVLVINNNIITVTATRCPWWRAGAGAAGHSGVAAAAGAAGRVLVAQAGAPGAHATRRHGRLHTGGRLMRVQSRGLQHESLRITTASRLS
jgi:hypothetical protein